MSSFLALLYFETGTPTEPMFTDLARQSPESVQHCSNALVRKSIDIHNTLYVFLGLYSHLVCN